ncbi:EamA family transporter [Pendulispora brunnea]|uniref:EamA family transporter n=1 Tax=Pendulispora brunnea TaxID=2905690 RepID=A0ABZ2K6Y4_9BACT
MGTEAHLLRQAPARSQFLPWAALITVWFLWGSTYLGIRAAVETIPPFIMAGARYGLAGAAMFAVLGPQHARGKDRLTWPQVRSSILIGALLLVGGNGLLSLSEKKLHSGLAALIVATVPAWMVLIHAAVTKSRIPGPLIAALVLGTAGVAVLVGGPGSAIDLGATAIVLVASVFWAAGSVFTRMVTLPKHPLVGTSLQMLSGGVLLLILGAARGELASFHLAEVSTRSAMAMVWLTILGSMVAFSAYVYAIRTLPNDIVATYAYVNPIVAVALGAVVDKEPVTRNLLLGGAIIVGSVVLIVSDRAKRNAAEQRRAG